MSSTPYDDTGDRPELHRHPSQAEGEDPDRAPDHPDVATPGHPSQAEGEDEDEDG